MKVNRSDDEKMKDGQIEKGSVDTIAYAMMPNTTLLVIDFTTSPPNPSKIDKIRDSAKFISEKLSIPTTPVIICNKSCHHVKVGSKTSGSNVIIIDKNDTDKLVQLISSNGIEAASQEFQYMTIPPQYY
ncbi:MAG: hypothetical protein WCC17_16880 [Candidatus Nitrosopolaris sp.]